ncbi:hypothetical protein E2553_38920 [Paraburkholderia dipogonis]|uniref:Uncharacterized protein n=1 Tax=Paraburkholderia dipogonis TaxID=1211383 RepID=A0A4Y8MJ25_9BURK|nr:hypothetical protein [Paraburkholderia dipogonis]TFE37445.1 hypothetical protein E2553_38920 [Paraburkholderia dipogonis]
MKPLCLRTVLSGILQAKTWRGSVDLRRTLERAATGHIVNLLDGGGSDDRAGRTSSNTLENGSASASCYFSVLSASAELIALVEVHKAVQMAKVTSFDTRGLARCSSIPFDAPAKQFRQALFSCA